MLFKVVSSRELQVNMMTVSDSILVLKDLLSSKEGINLSQELQDLESITMS